MDRNVELARLIDLQIAAAAEEAQRAPYWWFWYVIITILGLAAWRLWRVR